MFSGLNWLAIIVCTFFSMVLGFFWYGPLMFDKTWMKLAGIKPEEVQAKDSLRGHLVSLVGSFIAVVALAVIVRGWGGGALRGLSAGGFLGFSLVATSYFSNDAYEKRPVALTLINAGYRLAYFAVSGAILGAWS